MKSMLLVSVFCLVGCGGPGPVDQPDAGEDSASESSMTPDAASAEGGEVFGEAGGIIGCDCYTCPYGFGCMPSTGHDPPNPTTVHNPHSYTFQ